VGVVVVSRRVAGDERGASLVEFALVAPLLVMMLLGIFTGGQAYFQKISVTDSVREGARYGATLRADFDDLPNTWETKVRDRVAAQSGGELAPGNVCAKLVRAEADAAPWSCGVANPDGATGYLVKVSASKGAKVEWLVGSTNVTLRGNTVARYERSPLADP
jgi:Flp pilus assembly protein TadG